MHYLCTLFGRSINFGSYKKERLKCLRFVKSPEKRRVFDVNLFTKKFYWVEEDEWINLTISAAGLRLINKIGLDAAIKRAAANGYL